MSKSVVFFFSGSGNSLKVAQDISAGIESCDLVSMGKPHQLQGQYDSIGFVFPSYAMGLPKRVDRFINELDLSKTDNSYIFVVVTCGTSPGTCLTKAAKLIRQKGVKFSYGNHVIMFASYVGLYAMADDAGAKAVASDEALKPIIEAIQRKKTLNTFKSNPVLSVVHGLFNAMTSGKDKDFIVSDSCNGCSICEQVCSVDNIRMAEGKPTWLHHCEQCMACIQWCPLSAINVGDKTQDRGRYHHPEVRLQDMVKAGTSD